VTLLPDGRAGVAGSIAGWMGRLGKRRAVEAAGKVSRRAESTQKEEEEDEEEKEELDESGRTLCTAARCRSGLGHVGNELK